MTSETVARGDGRERVLREAVRLFGESGFAGTSVRSVAAAAGVSPANVMHHFGTKDALREAADERVVGELTETLKGAARAVLDGDPVEVGAVVGDPAVRGYLRRVLLDGGPAGEALVGELLGVVRHGLGVAEAAGRVRPGADLDYAAVQVLSLALGPLVLGPLIDGFESRSTLSEVAARAAADICTLRDGLLRPR
ncbi:MAG: transcriptional regulator, TetR family [Frankiales bacterium]|nr:transcriptional regulator, TetR family [Frankiales bacterium]